MQHIIRGIGIEEVSTHTTCYDFEKIIRCGDNEHFEICVIAHGTTAARIRVKVCGNICSYVSDNNDIILKHVEDYEVIREELKKPEDIKDWTKLLA